MVTTKKIDIKYTKKKLKICLFYSRKSTIHKKDDMQELRDRKSMRHIENKQQNDRNLFLSVIISKVNVLNCPIKR